MAKKKTDYIEDEGMAYDDDDYVGKKMKAAQDVLEELAKEEEYQNMVLERRMAAWEQASRATQNMAAQACKAMKTEFKLRVAQLFALLLIAVILLAK